MMRRKKICLATAVIFSLLTNLLYFISIAYADPLSIGYASRQMSTAGTQTLTATGGSGSYTWSIPGGGGTLSNSDGSSTTYTAPNSNANCVSNPIVRLADSAGQYVDLPMAVNGYPYAALAVRISGDSWCNDISGSTSECGMTTYYFDCHGDLANPAISNGCKLNPCSSSHTSVGNCGTGICINTNLLCDCCSSICASIGWKLILSPEDLTLPFPYLRNGGCCPWNAPPQIGPNDTGGACSGSPGNPNVDAGSSGNIKSGNLYESLDVAGLTLSYNGIASLDATPVGTKWTHNYNVTLTAIGDNVTLILKTADGNMIYFRLSAGVYYPEPRSGDTTRIVKNSNGTYTRTMKNGTIHQFNTSGHLTSITDRNNNTTQLTYTSGNLTSITDTNGRITTLTYGSGGRIATITDPAGRTYTLTNSGYSNYLLTQVTDPLGHAWTFTYTSTPVFGLLHTTTDPVGKTTTYTYDAKGRLLTSTDPENKTRSLNYTQAGMTTYTEKDDSVWTYKYDPTYAVKTEKTDPLGNTTRYAYDLKRNLVSTTDPNGGVTTYTYDSNSNLTSVTDPLGNTTSYTYNSMNLVASRTDPRWAETTYAYDTHGNLTTITAPLGNVTTFAYDTKGNVTGITDAYSHTTTLAYDSHNNLTSITDPLNRQTWFTYDTAGNRLSMTDPMGNVTSYVYNALNQMTQVTDPKGNITHFTYNYKGDVLTTTDANGKPTTYAYNYRGQVTQITDALNGITQMTYGPSGCGSSCGGADKLASLTDALNHTTQYIHDQAGRLTTETDPLGKVISHTYDAKGNLITKTKPDGKTITYSYDAANRLTQKQYSDGSITQYQYDASGNMTYAGNSAIAYNFAYDANNRVTGITDSNNRTIQNQYDALGNRTQMITPENSTITYAYDANKRLTGITTGSSTYTLTYDDAGRRSTLTYPNNIYATYTYDYSSNITRVWHKTQGGTTIADINYTYDSVNNRLSRVDTATTASEQTSIDAMNYDEANELLNLNTTTYNYDFNGNRIQKAETGVNTTYTYDDENRLVRVEMTGTPSQVITYAYDPFGRRIEKNVNGMITRYVYDKEAIILEHDQSGTVTSRYTHGLGIDEPLSIEKNSQMYYYHADALGSVIALTRSTGSVLQRYSYDAFGNITSGTPTITQPYMYTGREYDPETGLYFYRARYYDSKAGRFLSRDPIGFEGGNVNLYAYVQNNPVNNVDPSGLGPIGRACGSGWSEFFVPDCWFGWYSFYSPCKSHDNCYDNCAKTKEQCDSEFLNDMLKVCSSLSPGSYWKNHCEGTAYIYYSTVIGSSDAKKAFDSARKCKCGK